MKTDLSGKEVAKVNALRQGKLIGTDPDEAFDRLARLTAHVCGAPIAFIGFVDTNRVWFKAKLGLDGVDISCDSKFYSRVLRQGKVVVIPDFTEDKRFNALPLATSSPPIRSCAIAPLQTAKGHGLGILGVMDYVPRELQPEQVEMLEILGRQVMVQLEQSRHFKALTQAINERRRAEQTLKESQIRLQLLNSISTRITAGMSVEQVIEYTVRKLANTSKL